MSIIVQKFGGTSVGNIAKIQNVAKKSMWLENHGMHHVLDWADILQDSATRI